MANVFDVPFDQFVVQICWTLNIGVDVERTILHKPLGKTLFARSKNRKERKASIPVFGHKPLINCQMVCITRYLKD